MNRRRTLWDHLRWDLGALAVVVCLVVGYSALQSPRLQPAEHDETHGSKPPDRTEGDVLFVTPMAPAGEAAEFNQLDCTFSWHNALWHHYGTFASTPSQNLSSQLLAGHTMVVVPSRVAAELSTSARDDLRDFVENGGQLIVEMPRDGWSRITGISTIGQVGQARSITSAEGLGDYGPLRDHLLDVPLAGRLLPSGDLDSRPTGPVVFEAEEQPALITESVGDGQVLSILFDFGCTLAALHQGLPTERMAFGPPDRDRWIPTAERVGDDELLTAEAPYANVLERAVFDRIPESRPMARLWAYPAEYDGAAMSIHAAEQNPRSAFGYAGRAHDQDAASTIFAAPDQFSPDHAGVADAIGADVGLLWVLGRQRAPVTEGVGIGAIEPWRRELTLTSQQSMLDANLAAESPATVARTEGAVFESDWDSTFRVLTAAGVEIDASFGPADSSQHGYLFGTGMPFHPLDRRGRPFPILEAPYLLDGASISAARLRRIFEQSQNGFHQPVVVSLGAEAMKRDPAATIMLGFREFHDMARAHDHWLTTVSDYVDFLRARRESVITSQWSDEQARLTISVNLLSAQLATASDGAVPGVAIPAQFDGGDIEAVHVDDDPVSLASLRRSGPADERILGLEAGRHVITVDYESESGEDGGD